MQHQDRLQILGAGAFSERRPNVLPRHYSPGGQAEHDTDSEQNSRWHDRSFLTVAFFTNDRLQWARTKKSLLLCWTRQRPQRHQRSDRNVLGIPKMFFGERQGFHNVSRLVLGLRVNQEDDSLAVAARIP